MTIKEIVELLIDAADGVDVSSIVEIFDYLD